LIWERYVREEMTARGEWLVVDYKQGLGHRPDFLACHDGSWAVIAARIAAVDKESNSVKTSTTRLLTFPHEKLISGRLIVIPDIRYAKLIDPRVRIVKLTSLLAHPDCAFKGTQGSAGGPA
jgi:hypothetical protein